MDVGVWGAGEADEGDEQGGQCGDLQDKLRDCAGAVFFPVVRGVGGAFFCGGELDLELARVRKMCRGR